MAYFYQYRKWTKELDYAIDEIQCNMKLECEKYFKDIMPNAIKVRVEHYHDKLCIIVDNDIACNIRNWILLNPNLAQFRIQCTQSSVL